LGPGDFGIHKKILKFFDSSHTQGLKTVTGPKGAKPERKLQLL
jgi:hypothetical protein